MNEQDGPSTQKQALYAQSEPGQMVLQKIPAVNSENSANENIPPLKMLITGGRTLLAGAISVFKDRKRLIPVAILAATWLLLLFFNARGIDWGPLRFLNFLTFARGGLQGGILGFLGGIVGKGMFAYLLTLIVVPLLQKRNPFTGLGSRLSGIKKFYTVKDLSTLFLMVLGAGFALIAYNFLTGDASPQNNMVGITALVLTLRSLTSRAGFLKRFIRSLLAKYGVEKNRGPAGATHIMAGMAAGFAFSLPLSYLPIGVIGYVVGALLIVISMLVKVIHNRKKGVPAA